MRHAWEGIEILTHFDGEHEEKHHLENLAVYETMVLKFKKKINTRV
jgi:hypothetical protein